MWAGYHGESGTTFLSSATIASCGHSGFDQLGSYSSIRGRPLRWTGPMEERWASQEGADERLRMFVP